MVGLAPTVAEVAAPHAERHCPSTLEQWCSGCFYGWIGREASHEGELYARLMGVSKGGRHPRGVIPIIGGQDRHRL
jgi:hypothetical protein